MELKALRVTLRAKVADMRKTPAHGDDYDPSKDTHT